MQLPLSAPTGLVRSLLHWGSWLWTDWPWSGSRSGLDDERLCQDDRRLSAIDNTDACWRFGGITINSGCAPEDTWLCEKTMEVRTAPADGGTAKGRVESAFLLLSFRRTKTWNNLIVTEDEKWVVYANIYRKQTWGPPGKHLETRSKSGLRPETAMQIWWDSKAGCCLNCCYPKTASLGSSTAHVWPVWPDGVNVSALITAHSLPPRQSKTPRHKHRQLEAAWAELGMIIHSPGSPDPAPSGYYLILSMSNLLRYNTLSNENDLNQCWEDFFDTKLKPFIVLELKICPENGWKCSVVPVNTLTEYRLCTQW